MVQKVRKLHFGTKKVYRGQRNSRKIRNKEQKSQSESERNGAERGRSRTQANPPSVPERSKGEPRPKKQPASIEDMLKTIVFYISLTNFCHLCNDGVVVWDYVQISEVMSSKLLASK